MSIATTHGDRGETGLIGGQRVSKADLRVDALGDLDELNATLGFARSLCTLAEIAGWTETIQRTLFRLSGAIASPAPDRRGARIEADDVAFLTGHVHRIEETPGLLSDWSLPGAHTGSAAYEVARTVCRRAERSVVRLAGSGAEVAPEVLSYLNRLSDLLWLFGRVIEREAGKDSRLRTEDQPGPAFSRAW